MKSGLEGRNNSSSHVKDCQTSSCLNEVRPRRPEQLLNTYHSDRPLHVSMKSGLEGRNNMEEQMERIWTLSVSMKSGLEGRNNSLVLAGANREAKSQ